jgi:hypothetical protein
MFSFSQSVASRASSCSVMNKSHFQSGDEFGDVAITATLQRQLRRGLMQIRLLFAYMLRSVSRDVTRAFEAFGGERRLSRYETRYDVLRTSESGQP